MGTIGGGVTMFDGFRFITYTTDNGLTDNNVRTIMQEKNGDIWIGTDFGITIYDGSRFRTLTKNNGLKGTSIIKLLQSENGTVWAGTSDGGLSAIIPGDSLKVTNFSTDQGLGSDFIYDIYEAPDRKLWLGMVGGLNIIDVSYGDSIYLKNITDPMLPSDLCLSIAGLPDGTFLAGTRNNGLYRIVQNGDEFLITASSLNTTYPSLTIWDILIKPDNEIWLATDENGVIILNDNKIIVNLNKTNGLPSNRIMNFLKDDEGNTWFCTLDQGAVMFKNRKLVSYGGKEGLPGNNALSIFFDPGGKLYVGTEEGMGVFQEDGEKITRSGLFTTTNGMNDQKATSVAWYDKKLYVGTNDGINILDGNRITSFPLNNELPSSGINCLLADSRNNLWIGSGGGYSKYSGGRIYSMTQDDGLINNEVQCIIEDSKMNVWLGTLGGLARITGDQLTDFVEEDGLTYKKIYCLAEDPAGNIWIGTFGGGIFRLDVSKDSVPISNIATNKILSSNNINSLLFINDSMVVAGTDKGFDLLSLDDKFLIRRAVHYGPDDGFAGGENMQNSIARDNDGIVWFGTKNGVVRFDPSLESAPVKLPETTISGVRLFFEKVDWDARKIKTKKWTGLPESLVLPHRENHVTFEVTGFFYDNPADLMFSYFLDPQSKEWTPYNPEREIQLPSLSPGHYTLKVKARNKYGMVGNTAEYNFIIKPPFYRTKGFIGSASFIILLSVFAFFRIREKKLVEEKIKLEKIVQERTREVVEQKDEIEKQRDVVTSQKKEITDSIYYAERIQKAVLPDDKVLKNVFSDYFVILRPKDIVSGDFYWMALKNDRLVFTAADCTGHGVPGAFMSMLGVSFLNKIVNESGITVPSAILNSLRENIISALKQKGVSEDAKDGMDISLCCVDKECRKLYFAGANNPLYLIRRENGSPEFIELKGDSMPVGVYTEMSPFTLHDMELKTGDTLYLFSDGFLDQFGGPDGKKFMKTRFRQMLLGNQDKDMSSQKEIYLKVLEEWMNYPSEKRFHNGQIDDIILLGVRV